MENLKPHLISSFIVIVLFLIVQLVLSQYLKYKLEKKIGLIVPKSKVSQLLIAFIVLNLGITLSILYSDLNAFLFIQFHNSSILFQEIAVSFFSFFSIFIMSQLLFLIFAFYMSSLYYSKNNLINNLKNDEILTALVIGVIYVSMSFLLMPAIGEILHMFISKSRMFQF
jgi:hypothetical protein